ncbi:MAG: PH domain-containing protein [Dehalococcoidia bacterium]
MKLPVALQPDESVTLICHRHPLYLLLKLAGVALLLLAPLAAVLWLDRRALTVAEPVRVALYGGYGLWALYWLARGYFIWYRHRHDLWVVTNQRLIDSYKQSWFDHRLSSADLVNVQDISVHRAGLLGTLFNFGDVRCQTAGTDSAFVLAAIPRPTQTLTLIDAARDTARLGGASARRAGRDEGVTWESGHP